MFESAYAECKGSDPYIYQDIVSYGLANGWPPQTLADVSEGLIRGHQIGKSITSQNLQFGDLVFFNKYDYSTISHVGIYIGNGQFVHATTREGVAVSSLNKRYYRIRYMGALVYIFRQG